MVSFKKRFSKSSSSNERLIVELTKEVELAQITIYNTIGSVLGEFTLTNGRLIAMDLNKINVEDGFILVSIKEGENLTIKKVIVVR